MTDEMIHKESKAWSIHIYVLDSYPNAPEAPASEYEHSKWQN